jgi:hypothetical protein
MACRVPVHGSGFEHEVAAILEDHSGLDSSLRTSARTARYGPSWTVLEHPLELSPVARHAARRAQIPV